MVGKSRLADGGLLAEHRVELRIVCWKVMPEHQEGESVYCAGCRQSMTSAVALTCAVQEGNMSR